MTTKWHIHPKAALWAPSYSGDMYDPKIFPQAVEKIARCVKALDRAKRVDAVAGIGQSGLLLLGALQLRLGVPIIAVRKGGEASHDLSYVNGLWDKTGQCNYLFVDDLIDSGATWKRVITKVTETIPNAKCIGALLYGDVDEYGENDPYDLTHLPVYSVSQMEERRKSKKKMLDVPKRTY